MTQRRLSRSEVEALLPALADDLTPRQLARLRDLASLIGEDRTFPMVRALDVATTSRDDQARQAAFRQFRRSIASAAGQADLKLAIEVDGQRVHPDLRRCWFQLTEDIESQLADLSRREASRGASGVTVGARAQEVLAGPRPTQVYVCTAPKEKRTAKVQEFVDELRLALTLRADGPWEVTSGLDVPLGDDVDEHRHELIDSADVVVALVSPALLTSAAEIPRLASHGHLVLAPFLALPSGELKMHGLKRDHLLPGRPYCQASAQERQALLAQVIRAILIERDRRAKVLSAPDEDLDNTSAFETWAWGAAGRRMDAVVHVSNSLRETSLDDAAVGLSPKRHLGKPVAVLDRLLDWAAATTGPQLCALLGDVGTGKTTAAKLLTQRMLEERAGDKSIPLPLYFDLRDLSKDALRGNPTLSEVLTALLRATEDAGPHHPTVNAVVTAIRQGGCLVIFDGLDEALVHLPPHEQQLFTRTLWRATSSEQGSLNGPEDRPRSKLLLTCRTHFFRSIRDEAVHFTGQDRETPTGADHLALLMVPFTEEQIRAYVAANVPGANVDAVIATIDATHNLRELSARPLTLRMIVDQLEYIERAKLDGRTLRAADLYGAIVQRWLTRDDGKHSLLPDHKLLLMEHLAAQLWRSGQTSWRAQNVEQWLLEFLHARSDLELHYAARTPDLWKDDFRTATFLVRRDDDEFAFAHTSLQEYFLSRYLLRSLIDSATDPNLVTAAWSMPMPSLETLDFLGQGLAGVTDPERVTGLRALATLARQYRAEASELAFAYGLRAHKQNYPSHRLAGSVLDGAKLRGLRVEAPDDHMLDLSGVSLRGADLRDAVFSDARLRNANFDRANLTLAEFHRCDFTDAWMRHANLIGPIFRACQFDGLDCHDSTIHRAQRLLCTPPSEPTGPDWLGGGHQTHRLGRNSLLVLRPMTGNQELVLSVSFSQDGTRLASSSEDGSVRMWDATTGELLTTAQTNQRIEALSASFSPDGTRLASGGDDGSVQIWDATTGELLTTAQTEYRGAVRSASFSPDGTRLASGDDDGQVHVWDATTGELLTTAQTGQGIRVWSVSFSPDGTRLASGDDDGSVQIWDTTTGELLLATATSNEGPLLSLSWTQDGTRLASGDDGSVQIWDTTTGELLTTAVTGEKFRVLLVSFSPDGTQLASSGDAGPVQIWDTTTGELLTTAQTEHRGTVRSVTFSPDGTRLASGGDVDGSIQICDTTTGELLTTAQTGQGIRVGSVSFSPDGTRLASGGNDRQVHVWDVITGELLTTAQTGHLDVARSISWTPDGTQLIGQVRSGGRLSILKWDATTGELLTTAATEQTSWLWSADVSLDGTRVASSGISGPVRIWDTTTGELLTTITEDKNLTTSVCLSRDGTRIACGGGPVRIWDTTTGELLTTTTEDQDFIRSVAFSPDGTRIASSSATDGWVRIWDTTTGELLTTQTGHQGGVQSLTWTPDGTRIASSSGTDGWVRTWDTTTGTPIYTAHGPEGPVESLTFSPDGTRLASGGWDASVRVWDATTGTPIGWRAHHLPSGQAATWDVTTNQLRGATEGAWRWLGWVGVIDGEMVRLPAETFGPLPSLQPRQV